MDKKLMKLISLLLCLMLALPAYATELPAETAVQTVDIAEEAPAAEDKQEIIPDEPVIENKQEEIIPEQPVVEDEQGEMIPEQPVIEDKQEEIIPDEPVVEDEQGEMIPEQPVIEDKQEEIIPDEPVVEDKQDEMIPEQPVVEDKQEEIIPDEHVVEDEQGEIIPEVPANEDEPEEIAAEEPQVIAPAVRKLTVRPGEIRAGETAVVTLQAEGAEAALLLIDGQAADVSGLNDAEIFALYLKLAAPVSDGQATWTLNADALGEGKHVISVRLYDGETFLSASAGEELTVIKADEASDEEPKQPAETPAEEEIPAEPIPADETEKEPEQPAETPDDDNNKENPADSTPEGTDEIPSQPVTDEANENDPDQSTEAPVTDIDNNVENPDENPEETDEITDIPDEPEAIVEANVAPTKVIPDVTSITLDVLDTYTIGYSFLPAEAVGAVTFTSSAKTIAAVDKETGKITALKKGSATITLKTYNGKTAKVAVKVVDPNPPTSVALDVGSSISLSIDETLSIAPILTPSSAVSNILWSSSSTKYATVSGDTNSCVITPKKVGTVTIKAVTSNGKTASVKVKIFDPKVATGIAIDEPGPIYISLDEVYHTLTATVKPDTAVPYTTVKWSSSSSKIAKVDALTGDVTPIKRGSATITAKTGNGKKATVKVIVYDPLIPEYVTIDRTGTVDLSMDDYSLMLGASIFPDTAPQEVVWSTSNKKIATIDKDTGVVTPIKPGTVTITAKTGNGKKSTVKIRVFDPRVPLSISLNMSGIYSADFWDTGLTVLTSCYPATAEPYTTYKFSSSKTSIATVDTTGLITIKAAGSTVITVKTVNPYTSKSVSAKFTLRVVDPHAPAAIYIDQGTLLIMDRYEDHTAQLTYSLPDPSNMARVTWSSSASSIVSVDSETGEITAHKTGSATITAKTQNSKKDTIKVTVTDKHAPTSVYFASSSVTTYLDAGSMIVYPILTGADPHAEFTWKSSVPSVATVAANDEDSGIITLLKQGTTVITVTTHNGKSAKMTVKVVDPTMPATVWLEDANTGDKLSSTLAWDPAKDGALSLQVGAEAVGGSSYIADLGTVKWTSTSTTVATIDQYGNVTRKKNGTARFIATTTRGGKTASVTVTFYTYIPVSSIQLTTSASTIYVGNTLRLSYACLPAGSLTGAKLRFTSSDPSIIDVDPLTGMMTALDAGYATITCEDQETSVVSNSVYMVSSYPPTYRAIVIAAPSEKVVKNAQDGMLYNVTWNRTTDVQSMLSTLKLQNYGGKKYSITSLPAATKSSVLSAIDNVAAVSHESDVTVIAIMAEGSDNGTIWLGSEALGPSALAEALSHIEGRVIVYMANDYSGYYITEGSGGEATYVSANAATGANFSSAFISAFKSHQTTVPAYALDKSGNPILPPAAAQNPDGSIVENNWGELRDDKFYVITACTAFEEAYWLASVKLNSWDPYSMTASLNEAGCYDYFIRGLCLAGGYNAATARTAWSGKMVTLASAASQTASYVKQHESASSQTGYSYSNVSVYPANSSYVVFQH